MVRVKFWISTVMAGVVGALLTCPSLPAQPAPPAPGAADESIRPWVAILNDRNASDEQRKEAAYRLVNRRTSASREEVRKFLDNLQLLQSQSTVANALADNADPDPQFIQSLFAMLTNPANPSAGNAAARALTTYKDSPPVLNRLRDAAGPQAANKADDARIFAIAALGGMCDQSAADLLMQLLIEAREAPRIHSAAAQALAAMVGQSRDVRAWQKWWADNQPKAKTPQQFRNDLLTARALEFDALKSRYDQLRSDTRNLMEIEYQNTPANPPNLRTDKLMGYLKSSNPVMREEAAEIIRSEKLDGKQIPPPAVAELRKLINDRDRNVRLAVGAALTPLVDAASLDPLLQQLAREDDPAVRAQLALALGPLGDLKAAPLLLELLKDRGQVAAAAAESLKDLAPKIKTGEAQLARDTANALKAAFETTKSPASQQLRESTVAAMAELGDPSLQDTLKDALNPNESPKVLKDALRGLGNLHNQRNGDLIEPYLKNEDLNVKGAAIDALRDSGFYSQSLPEMLKPGAEDTVIQSKVWTALQSFLPALDGASLQQIADNFMRWNDPAKRIVVLNKKVENERRDKSPQLPFTLQNLGAAEMENGDYADAALHFDQAITEQSRNHKPTDAVMVGLYTDKLKALLQGGKYEDAGAFARQWIEQDKSNRGEVGTAFKMEAERLKGDADQNPNATENGLKLIAESKKLDLPEPFVGQIQTIENQLKQIQEKNKGSGLARPTPVPRPGNATAGASQTE